MTLRALVKDLNDVPDALREHYKKRDSDGMYVLELPDADDAYGAGLKANRDEALGEAKKLRDKLKEFEGLDPTKARELMTAAEKAEEARALKAGEFEGIKKQMADKHATELQAERDKLAKATAQIETLMRDNVLASALKEHKGNDLFLMPHLRNRVKVRQDETTGEWLTEVVDEKGNRLVADGQGQPMTIPSLVASFKQDPKFAGAFEGSGASGSGAAGSNGSTAAASGDMKRSAMTEDQRFAYLQEHGLEKFQALPQ